MVLIKKSIPFEIIFKIIIFYLCHTLKEFYISMQGNVLYYRTSVDFETLKGRNIQVFNDYNILFHSFKTITFPYPGYSSGAWQD